ncbi:MAG: hypothetical protein PHW73_00915 [Atribacterota bacterium]|nr:hypothetical protein [Atribacterota bacterium]
MGKKKYVKTKFRGHRFQYRFSDEMSVLFGGITNTRLMLKKICDNIFIINNKQVIIDILKKVKKDE